MEKKHHRVRLRNQNQISDPVIITALIPTHLMSFLCLFILLYVSHQALGVYSGSDWIVEVQLIVKGAFSSQDRAG